jgi:competence protein ComEC
MLLTGDAEQALERELIRSGKNLRADILKVAHHGSRSSTGAAFLEAVRPRLAVVSTGAGSPYLPSARVLHRLRARGVTTLRTDLDGAVSIGLDRDGGIQVETFKNRH